MYLGGCASTAVESLRQEQRIAHARDYIRRVPPERSTASQPVDGVGMILVVRDVRDRVALDCFRNLRCGFWRETAHQRLRPHRWMLIQIGKRVDRDDREP